MCGRPSSVGPAFWSELPRDGWADTSDSARRPAIVNSQTLDRPGHVTKGTDRTCQEPDGPWTSELAGFGDAGLETLGSGDRLIPKSRVPGPASQIPGVP